MSLECVESASTSIRPAQWRICCRTRAQQAYSLPHAYRCVYLGRVPPTWARSSCHDHCCPQGFRRGVDPDSRAGGADFGTVRRPGRAHGAQAYRGHRGGRALGAELGTVRLGLVFVLLRSVQRCSSTVVCVFVPAVCTSFTSTPSRKWACHGDSARGFPFACFLAVHPVPLLSST